MSKSKQLASLALAKKQIRKRLGKLEARLLSASNPLELVVVYNEMEEVMSTEIDQWLLLLSVTPKNESLEYIAFQEEALQQIEDLTSIMKKVNSAKALELPKAMQVQSAMLRGHKLDKPLIKITD